MTLWTTSWRWWIRSTKVFDVVGATVNRSNLAPIVNPFFARRIIDKELEAVTKLKVIKQQLFVANEWKRRYDVRKVWIPVAYLKETLALF